jgi:replicative DNA helicase
MENNVLKTGYRRLDDKYYGGIKRGELTMLYSRIGMGKSALLSNVFLNMISQIPQTKCMFFAFDEPEKYVFEKMVCIKSGVSYWKYFNGENCTDKEKQKVRQTEEWLGEKVCAKTSKSRIIDKAHSLAELLICIAEAKASYGLDVVFIDRLEYLRDYAYEDINHVVYILKELAVRLDIAVLATAYLARSKRDFPITCRIKNKYILRTADKIMILNRPEVLATAEELESGHIVKGAAELNIIKNYTGACGFISLKFDGSTMRFYEPENDYDEYEPEE